MISDKSIRFMQLALYFNTTMYWYSSLKLLDLRKIFQIKLENVVSAWSLIQLQKQIPCLVRSVIDSCDEFPGTSGKLKLDDIPQYDQFHIFGHKVLDNRDF